MAKAIIVRRIEFLPANPNSKCRSVDISLIESIDHAGPERPGETVIILKSGKRRYSSEDVFEICRAYEEAKK